MRYNYKYFSLYDWTEVEWAIWGWNKLLAWIDASFKITDELNELYEFELIKLLMMKF